MRKFHPVNYRCQNCQTIFLVDAAEVKKCPKCEIEKDFGFLLFMDKPEPTYIRRVTVRIRYVEGPITITDENLKKYQDLINEVRQYNRTDGMVDKRIHLIRILREEFKLSYLKIGELLHRDHSSIIHLYKLKKDETD